MLKLSSEEGPIRCIPQIQQQETAQDQFFNFFSKMDFFTSLSKSITYDILTLPQNVYTSCKGPHKSYNIATPFLCLLIFFWSRAHKNSHRQKNKSHPAPPEQPKHATKIKENSINPSSTDIQIKIPLISTQVHLFRQKLWIVILAYNITTILILTLVTARKTIATVPKMNEKLLSTYNTTHTLKFTLRHVYAVGTTLTMPPTEVPSPIQWNVMGYVFFWQLVSFVIQMIRSEPELDEDELVEKRTRVEIRGGERVEK